jgi:hypothetical protein
MDVFKGMDTLIIMRVFNDGSASCVYVPNTISGPFADLDEAMWFISRNPTTKNDSWSHNSTEFPLWTVLTSNC